MFARTFDDALMARAIVELPEGWGPARVVRVAVERLGYDVTHIVDPGAAGYLIVK